MANEEEGAGFVVRLMLETCQWLYCLFAILTGFCVLYGPNGGSKRLENGCWSFVSFPTHLEAVKSLTKISLTTTQIPIQNLQVGLCNFFFFLQIVKVHRFRLSCHLQKETKWLIFD